MNPDQPTTSIALSSGAMEQSSGARPRGAETEEMFRLLVESVRDYAIFMLDTTGHITTWNIGAERIKGYSTGEIIGRHFSTFYPEDLAGACAQELEVAARDGRFEDEGWRVRKDGTRFWANVVISAVRDRRGELVGFSKVTRDLTERKLAEEERSARRAAEEANRAKDDFLAILGHELRNPLAPIMTAVQLMKLRSDGQLSKEQQVIERQVNQMVRLVEDLLDVSRIAKGKIALKKQRVDLRDTVARAIETASALLDQRRHRVRVDAPAHEIAVEGDDARLTQVFANLVTNAAKYTNPGGNIQITVERQDREAVVQVIDDGVGIDPAMLPRIFDLFVQGPEHSGMDAGPINPTPRGRAGGLGIGLTLVRKLVHLHGGTVVAHSDGAGRGSRFTVRLPAAAARAIAIGA